jgi:hypothetical protein
LLLLNKYNRKIFSIFPEYLFDIYCLAIQLNVKLSKMKRLLYSFLFVLFSLQNGLPQIVFNSPDALNAGSDITLADLQTIENEMIFSEQLDEVIITNGNLPIIKINTLGETILDDPKITAMMSVINNPGGVNSSDDINYEYYGYIGIEIRGRSSQMFDKKNYGFETRTEDGENLNVSLLGMPEENDWVLHGPYTDKALMRNVLAYHLGSLTGRWAPRTRFCELYINDDYRGVYVLIEWIKRDKNRINIATLNENDIAGDDVTGGYVLKIDRPNTGAWVSPYDDIPISYVHPKYNNLTPEQREYIKNYITEFEHRMNQDDFSDPVTGYRSWIDVTSFIDFYLINELSHNVDAYRLSTYFYKDKDSKDPRIVMGPVWDHDIGFGNARYAGGNLTYGWVRDSISKTADFRIPFWWDKLLADTYFDEQIRIRWNELRKNKFSTDNINRFIDSCATLLSLPQQRNFEKFPILGIWVWPNNYVGGTYEKEVNYLKNFVNERLIWMDSQLEYTVSTQQPVQLSGIKDMVAFPNPFSERVTLKFNLMKNSAIEVKVKNILGVDVYQVSVNGVVGNNEIYLGENVFGNGAGIYLFEILVDSEFVGSGKLIKK